jgi:hypothetical protein
VGATCVDVDGPGARLTPNRFLARESASSACPKVPVGQGALLVVWLRLFHLCLLQQEGRRWRSRFPSSGQGSKRGRVPWLGEAVVGVVSRWEEHHVITKAKRHELETPEPDHRVELQTVFRIGHLEP